MSIIAGWSVSEESFSQFSGKTSRALGGVSNEHRLSPSLAIGFDGRDNNTCSFSLWSQNKATLLLLSLASVAALMTLGAGQTCQGCFISTCYDTAQPAHTMIIKTRPEFLDSHIRQLTSIP